MDRQIIKQTIADIIHLTPARQAEVCYSVTISDQDSKNILISLKPTLDYLSWSRIGSKDRKALYESMVFHAGLAVGNLTSWLEEEKMSYTVSKTFPEMPKISCPNAQELLSKNIEFIAHETVAWIELQRYKQIGVFDQYQYDSVKCHRDLRFVLNALVQDLEYLGNENTCSVLMEYFDRTGMLLVRQSVELCAYEFVRMLIKDVMMFRTPEERYQAHTFQWKRGAEIELDAIKWLEELMNIILIVLSQGLDAMPSLVTSYTRQQDKIEVIVNV